MAGRNLPGARCGAAARSAVRFPLAARRLFAVTVASIVTAGLADPASAQSKVAGEGLAASLRASDVVVLRQRCGSADPVSDSYQLTQTCAVAGPGFDKAHMVAFEENRFFIYAVSDTAKGGAGRAQSPRLLRRLVLLKPATLVVDDELHVPASQGPVRWLFRCRSEPEVAGPRICVAESDREIVCDTLLPKEVAVRSIRPAGDAEQADHAVAVVPEGGSHGVRFLHVLHVGAGGQQSSATRPELVENDGPLRLTVFTSDRTFRLTLPPARGGADEIEVTDARNETLLGRRLLPSGILPYGPEGTRLLERWDSAYRGGHRPGWDTGRPSSTLKKAVEEGTLRPCRAVVLGCGSGNNAVWLAGQGFDVTGIDIAPAALNQGMEKARKAGVSVRWLLADVLAPPELEPFDFVFDRGCYHGVRRQNAAGYVESVRRLTRPGALVLILAGNANQPGRGGPPRVKEQEIRADFASWFEFEWLRETRFDRLDAAGKGALAWSVLLRRTAEP